MRRAWHATDRQHRNVVQRLNVTPGNFTHRSTPLAEKKAYPLRISSEVLDAMQRWAQDELRSVNAQIEYVLREALRKSGRMNSAPPESGQSEVTSD